MKKLSLTPKIALAMFLVVVVVALAQATWWIVFMAHLVDEKVDMAIEMGAGEAAVEALQSQEVRRQVMVGMEGIFFLILILVGAWLIYRALVKTEELKFHQQNFLMAVTHELKTPLASMKIYLDSLRSEKISPEKKAEVLPRMKQDITRLEKMVENILDAGRFERSGYRLNKSVIDLGAMVREAVAELRSQTSPGPVSIIEDIADGIRLSCDRRALSRAIGALLENGIRHNDKPQIEIRVSLARRDSGCRIIVSDNGVGLSSREIGRIFNRFYSQSKVNEPGHQGSGLGLYLAREIIRAHDGEIEAKSRGAGQGAEFTITLKASESA